MRTPYDLALESRVPNARPQYEFVTADGVHSKRSFRTAELLLADALVEAGVGRLLVPAANYGVVGVVLADSAAAVRMTESSARSVALCERNARRNDADATVSLVADLSALDGAFDAAAYAPKPYTPVAVGKQRAADALAALVPGGRLYLCGSAGAGLARYESALRDVADTVERRLERGEHAVVAATRPSSFEPPTYVSPRVIRPTVDGIDLSLVTVPGLFSPAGLDAGTRLLLETAGVGDGERVLDLCCGYGAVGAYAASAADCAVWLSDDDRVATRCAECSLDESGVEATVVTADCTAGVADRVFERVLCNPPTHAGRGVLADLFEGVRGVLAPGGELAVVHHRGVDLGHHLSAFDSPRTVRTGAEHAVVSATR